MKGMDFDARHTIRYSYARKILAPMKGATWNARQTINSAQINTNSKRFFFNFITYSSKNSACQV